MISRRMLVASLVALVACDSPVPEAGSSKMANDGLGQSTEAYVGQLLEVRPFHGYGWNESHLLGKQYTHKDIPPPAPFKLRLKRLWSFAGKQRRGGVGQVEMPGHPLDGMWVVFSTRHEGHYDFTDRIANYNVDMESAEPTEQSADGWPRVPLASPAKVAYSGYAEIGAVFPAK